jgi:hypothetical protein
VLLNIRPRQRRPFNRLRRRFLGVNLEIKVRHVAPGFALRVTGGDVGVGVNLVDGYVDDFMLGTEIKGSDPFCFYRVPALRANKDATLQPFPAEAVVPCASSATHLLRPANKGVRPLYSPPSVVPFSPTSPESRASACSTEGLPCEPIKTPLSSHSLRRQLFHALLQPPTFYARPRSARSRSRATSQLSPGNACFST